MEYGPELYAQVDRITNVVDLRISRGARSHAGQSAPSTGTASAGIGTVRWCVSTSSSTPQLVRHTGVILCSTAITGRHSRILALGCVIVIGLRGLTVLIGHLAECGK